MFQKNIKPTHSRRGFTMVELLVVLLILLILMSLSLPMYLNAVIDAQRKTCRANMQSIADTAVAARVRIGSQDYNSIITKSAGGLDILASDAAQGSLTDLKAIPACPNGGIYKLAQGNSNDNTTFRVTCSTIGVNAHGTYQPGVDGQ